MLIPVGPIEVVLRVASDDSGYCNFSTRPYEGWTIITLNSYEVGLLQDQTLKGYQEAARLMREYNPNPVLSQKQGINFFDNLSGDSCFLRNGPVPVHEVHTSCG